MLLLVNFPIDRETHALEGADLLLRLREGKERVHRAVGYEDPLRARGWGKLLRVLVQHPYVAAHAHDGPERLDRKSTRLNSSHT